MWDFVLTAALTRLSAIALSCAKIKIEAPAKPREKEREIGRKMGTEGSFVQFNCSLAYMKKRNK